MGQFWDEISLLYWPVGTLGAFFKISSFSDFERIGWLPFQTFEEKRSILFQNQLIRKERILREETKKFLKTLTSVPTGQFWDENLQKMQMENSGNAPQKYYFVLCTL